MSSPSRRPLGCYRLESTFCSLSGYCEEDHDFIMYIFMALQAAKSKPGEQVMSLIWTTARIQYIVGCRSFSHSHTPRGSLMCTYSDVYVHVYMNTYRYIYINIYIYLNKHEYIYNMYVYICIHISMYICICT